MYYNPVLSGQRLLDRGPVRGSPDPSHLGNGKEELWKTDMASARKELPPAAGNLMITITGITKSYKEGGGGGAGKKKKKAFIPVSSQPHFSVARKLSCNGVVPGENVCYGKWGTEQKPQPKPRPRCGPGAASRQPSAARTREGDQDDIHKEPRAEALFTSQTEGAKQPLHRVLHCERNHSPKAE